MTRHPSPSSNGVGASVSMVAGSPETISLGRPVLPPLVGAFHAGEMASGSPAWSAGGATKPAGMHRRPGTLPSATPTTAFGSASSMMASNSRGGRRQEIGWGMAPSRQIAR